ncbi:MAG: MMPL family transporter [Treponema sp.]|nr:MMPL family transporter [Treponema sp.]
MSKISSFLNKISNKNYLRVWLLYHLGLFAFFAIVFAINPSKISIDADLFNMFPRPFEEEGIRNADEKLTENVGQNVFVLVSHQDFARAKEVAEDLYNQLSSSENFKSLSLYSDLDQLKEITDFVYDYRWNLLSDEDIDLINQEGGAQIFAQNALAQAYSPFTMLPLDNLDSDPFMLAETNINNYLSAVRKSGTSMSVKDGVLASFKDGVWYVMLRGILSKKGASLASKDNGIGEIYSICSPLEKDGLKFVYSGTPFYSHQSSTEAMKEITIISTISLLVVIILLLFVFKSPVPVILSVISIFVSILTAFVATLAVFKKMHILTLVFGTSLIGSCIDYSLHYFTQWAGNPNIKTGQEIRNHLLKSLVMAITSSVLCYAILIFAPFNVLKQMSLFSLTGLISSFLTTMAIFPYIKLPEGDRVIKISKLVRETNHKRAKKHFGRVAVTLLFVFAIGVLLINHKNFAVKNDLDRLYTMEGRLLEDRIESIEITKYSPSGWFIIRGQTEEKALQSEYELACKLNKAFDGQMGFICTGNFVPSIEHQKKSREACRKLLELAPEQFENLGFDSSYTRDLIASFNESEKDYVSFSNNNVPQYITSSISTAWLGLMEDGYYYTVLMPNLLEDIDLMREFAADNPNIFFVNKMSDMGRDLDKLTLMIIKFFAIAYLLIFVMLKFFYNWKQSFKIISVPVLIVLMTGAIFSLAKINLEFFSVTGLILVFGLGLDYIIYMMENEKKKSKDSKTLEPFATLLSFITTIISFGALSLSNFQPVHLMGLSIFIGLATAYISSMLYDRSL